MKSILKYPFVRNSITTVFSSFAFTDEYGSQNHHSWPLEYFLKKYFFHPLAKHSNITQYNSATQANTCKLDAYKADIYWFTKNPKKRVSFKEFWYFDPWERSELLLLWESKIRSHESIVFNLPEIFQDKPHLHSIIIVSTWCTRGKGRGSLQGNCHRESPTHGDCNCSNLQPCDRLPGWGTDHPPKEESNHRATKQKNTVNGTDSYVIQP